MNPYFSGGGGAPTTADSSYNVVDSSFGSGGYNNNSSIQHHQDSSYYASSPGGMVGSPIQSGEEDYHNPYYNSVTTDSITIGGGSSTPPYGANYNSTNSGGVVSNHLEQQDAEAANTRANLRNMGAQAAREAAIAAGVLAESYATTSMCMPPEDELEGTQAMTEDALEDGGQQSLTNIEDADRLSKSTRARRAVGGAEEEVSAAVDSISHRWRVRAIYDDIGTAAPAAPDALSTFLKLRSDMLRPSTEVVRLKEARRKEDKEAKRVADAEKRRMDRVQARERRLRNATPLDRTSNFASTRNLSSTRADSQNMLVSRQQQQPIDLAGGGGVSGSDVSDDDGDDAQSDHQNDYDEDFLKGELQRALEQLQKAHSEAQNLQAQNGVMSKELRARQKKINDLEDWNQDLLEQNRELERTVHDLRSAAMDEEQQQMNEPHQIPGVGAGGGRSRVGSKPPAMKMSRNVSVRSYLSAQ